MRWTLREVDDRVVTALADGLGVRPVTARCIAGRGFADAGVARGFLEPRLASLRPPRGLAGLDAAVERLARAVTRKERVGVFGDYDVDGVTTCALLSECLRGAGVEVVPRVASRVTGYGFGTGDAEFFAAEKCDLVITGDCGTSDLVACEAAVRSGIDIVVIDHHTVPGAEAERTHPAVALVNPFCHDNAFPFQGLASVGLAFYVMAALRSHLRTQGVMLPDVRSFLDLVAVGTVADQVPLTAENRILTSLGLKRLSARERPGLAALLGVSGAGKGPLGEHVVGWKLGPRLNAPGRLGDARPALELLLADTRPRADALAAELEQLNDRRREEQQRVLGEAQQAVAKAPLGECVVVAGRGWASGVVGVVAARLVEETGRPAFVIAIDPETGIGRGSGRTCAGVNLYEALARAESVLERFGGHAAAAGLTVHGDRVGELAELLCSAVAEQGAELGHAPLCADAEVSLAEVDEGLVHELSTLAPFGQGNAEPLLVSRGLRVRQSRVVGDGSHLKLELEDRSGAVRGAIAFGQAEHDPGVGATVDTAFAPTVNEWRGNRKVELGIRGITPSA